MCLARGKNLPLLPSYPRIATFENPTRNSGQTSCPSYSKTDAEILRDIPVLSRYAPNVLDQFVTETVFTVHTAAGREIRSRTDASDNLYVMVAGSASLDAGDGVRVVLEAGDYFGGDVRHKLSAAVVATSDVEVLVISAEELARLQHSASRRHHPSNIDWTPEAATPSLRLLPSRRRFAVLARSGS
jgi:hypothetical protein